MRRFLKNTKGAVTVFVTLLLIPAVLISGTAVDLTRIYTARSIVQDANQLAANSVLSQYDALLHDLYGLFGVAKNDPVFAQLLDEYISVAVFGEENRDTSKGTLQLFYGSNLELDEIYFADGKNLRNPEVLRRQIEEYMKFRSPVIIVREVLELLGSSTFKEDAGVIDDKLQIDEFIAELCEKYKELYEAITVADTCAGFSGVGGMIGPVSSGLTAICNEFHSLKSCLKEWEEAREKLEEKMNEDDDDEEDGEDDEDDDDDDEIEVYSKKLEKLENEYEKILLRIEAKINGSKSAQGLYVTIENAIENTDTFKPNFDEVVKIGKELDGMHDELERMVEELEKRLASKECNPELYDALTKTNPGADKSVIESYRDILRWDDIEGMAKVFSDGGYEYIDGPVKDMLGNVKYRNKHNSDVLSLELEQLENASSLSTLELSEGNEDVSDLAYSGDRPATYNMPDGFVMFKDHPGDNGEFYEELQKLVSQPDVPPIGLYDEQEEADGGDSEDKQRNMIDELLALVDDAYAGIANAPLGAKYINGASGEKDDDKASNITQTVSNAMDDPVTDVISNPYGAIKKAADYLLLLTYCTSMFSNYTTGRPETNGKKIDEISDTTFPKSASGIPMGPKVNYFLQSEWEYLYNGSENAGKNLSAVSRLIYLVRVICNYITVFSVSDVTQVVNSIRTAFSWSPPLGVVLGELARAAFVAAESAVDLSKLRAGYKVPLIKNGKAGQWVCSPKGLTKALKEVASDTAKEDEKKDDKGLAYSNYLLFFFLAKGVVSSDFGTELTLRTANLIEWNVLNYRERVNCDEEKMAGVLSADGSFKMEDMKTDLSITTTVNMRMLFLSMPLARNFAGSRSINAPPQTIPIAVTDYRGY